MHDIKRILVVSRMTKYCQEAFHYGVSLAKLTGAELYIMHAIHNPFSLEGWSVGSLSLEKEYKLIIEEAKKDLDALIDAENEKGVPVKKLIREGEPTEEIFNAVKEEKIDLIITLAHEEGRMEHFLFGRSNEELIRKMPCSILMVKKEPGPAV